MSGFAAQPLLWHRMTIDGMPVPGVVNVRGGHERREDVLEVPGQDGAEVTHLGFAGAEFFVEVTMWTDAHAAAWQRLYQRIRPKKGEAARAVSVLHPALQQAGVRQLYVRRITVPEHAGHGIWKAELELVEYVPRAKRKKGRARAVQTAGPDVDLGRIPVIAPSQIGPPPPPGR